MAGRETGEGPSAFDSPMQARTGEVGPFGTLIEPLKTYVDFETAEIFRRWAHQRGRNASIELRDFVYKVARGKSYRQLSHEASEHTELPLPAEGLIEDLNKPVQPTGLPTFLRTGSK